MAAPRPPRGAPGGGLAARGPMRMDAARARPTPRRAAGGGAARLAASARRAQPAQPLPSRPPRAAQPDVVTKYKAAAKITNGVPRRGAARLLCRAPTAAARRSPALTRAVRCAPAAALAAVVEACVPGAKIVDLCDKGDSLMNECVPPAAVAAAGSALQRGLRTPAHGRRLPCCCGGCHGAAAAAVVAA